MTESLFIPYASCIKPATRNQGSIPPNSTARDLASREWRLPPSHAAFGTGYHGDVIGMYCSISGWRFHQQPTTNHHPLRLKPWHMCFVDLPNFKIQIGGFSSSQTVNVYQRVITSKIVRKASRAYGNHLFVRSALGKQPSQFDGPRSMKDSTNQQVRISTNRAAMVQVDGI